MKKHLLFLSALVIISVTAFTQGTIQLIDGWAGIANCQTYDKWEDINTTIIDFEFDTKNIGTSDKGYYMKREEIYIVPGSENYFCWKQCYASFVSVSPDSVGITANGTFFLSSSHYKSNGNMGTSIIRYIIYDALNANDSAWFIVNWHVTGVGINEANLISGNISAYPNPSNTSTTIKYDLKGDVTKASIKIYNLLGSVIKEMKVTNTSGTITVSTAELEQGIYFYSIVANDKSIVTRKLVVTH